MMASPGTPSRRQFAFYTETFMKRSEVWFYLQARGMVDADVAVLARSGAHLDEFPLDSLFLVDEVRRLPIRVQMAVERRLDRSVASRSKLPDYVVRRLASYLRKHRVDVIYCIFGWHAAQLLEVLERLERPVPFVFLAAGSDINAAEAYEDEYLARLRQVFDRASLILSGSKFLRKKLLELGAPEEKIRVHHIGVKIPALPANELSKTDGQFRVLAVSRLVEVKGVPHTIRAFALMRKKAPNAHLDIIGEGALMDECMALARELGVERHVTFRGSCSHEGVYEAMRRADIFVQHNIRSRDGHEESISGTMLEAAAHGVPVVVTRSGGNEEGVIHEKTGFLVEPGDEVAMAESMSRLYHDSHARELMGVAARSFAIRKFDIDRQNSRLERILYSIDDRM